MAIHVHSIRFRLIQAIVGVLWLVLTLVTAVLFLATGHPVQRSFIAWGGEPIERLPARYNPYGGTLDDFLWVSSSGQTYATASAHSRRVDENNILPDPRDRWAPGQASNLERVFEIIFRDTLSDEEVGRIKRFDHFPGRLCMSPDRRLLTVESFVHTLWRMPEGKQLKTLPGGSWFPLVFSSNGKLLLVDKITELSIWDVEIGREIASFGLVKPDGYKILWAGYFDERDRPYALISENREGPIELWNLTESKKVPVKAILTGSDEEQSPRAEYCQVAKEGDIVAITYQSGPDEPFTKIWSLSDGKLLGSFTLDEWLLNHTAISSDGRYFLHGAVREDKAFTKLVNSWPSVARWIPKEFLVKKESKVHDLSTGVCWPRLPECERATFVQGTDRLVIFNKAGRYEFDAPPRWQYFTPWAWVALGAWLSLIVIWWRKRKRQPQIAAVA